MKIFIAVEFVIFRAIVSCVVQTNVSHDWKQWIKTPAAALRTGKPDLVIKPYTNSRNAKAVHT